MPLAFNRKKVGNARPLKNFFCAALILLVALLPSKSFAQSLQAPKIKTVVIDAGHGGGDTGAMSKDKKYKEKNITLAVALKFGAMLNIAYPSINVIFTRNSDFFVPLGERPAIANRNKADLFISIHVNSEPGTNGTGTETFVMGTHKSGNFELVKRENSVITLENDYSSKYSGFNPNSPESYIIFSLLQNSHLEQSIKLAQCIQEQYKNGPIRTSRGVKPGALYVLWKAAMPAILTEIGFISNNNDLEIITSEEGQRQIASNLLKAFSKYKVLYEGGKLENLPPDAFTDENALLAKANEGQEIVKDNNQNKEDDNTVAEENKTENRNEENEKNVENEKNSKNVSKVNEKENGKDTILLYPADTQKTTSTENRNGSENFYCIQILSVNRELSKSAPDLKGRKDADFVKVGGAYKYYLGNWNTRSEATRHLNEVCRTFKGAFVIKISNGKIVN
jgi:N-acetylmuramoyl-L-alanine amidase